MSRRDIPVPGLDSSSPESDDGASTDQSDDFQPCSKKNRRLNDTTMEISVPLPIPEPNVPKRRVNNVWGVVVQENIVNQAMDMMNMQTIIRDRDVESYITEVQESNASSNRGLRADHRKLKSKQKRYHQAKNSESEHGIREIESHHEISLAGKFGGHSLSANNSPSGDSSDGCYSTDIHLDPQDVACSHDIDDDDNSENGNQITHKKNIRKRSHNTRIFPTSLKSLPKKKNKRKKNSIWSHGRISPGAPPHIIAQTLRHLLREQKGDLIERCVEILGGNVCNELYSGTILIEKSGGMMTIDGSRRRTLGGIFLHLVRNSDLVSKEQEKSIFAPEEKIRKVLKAVRKHKRRPETTDSKQNLTNTETPSNSQMETGVSFEHPEEMPKVQIENSDKEDGELSE